MLKPSLQLKLGQQLTMTRSCSRQYDFCSYLHWSSRLISASCWKRT